MNKEQPRDWTEIIVEKLIDHWIHIDLPLDFEKTIAKALREAYANGQKEIMENLAKQNQIYREALAKITQVSQFGRVGSILVDESCYEAAWLDCFEIAEDALSQTSDQVSEGEKK